MIEDDADRPEVEKLRSEWRAALTTARDALHADEDYLDPAKLRSETRHLTDEYTSAGDLLRTLARDEGLSPELAEPFLARRVSRRTLGLPATVRACVLELDGVLVASTPLHVEAWARSLDELLTPRIEDAYRRHTPPFDPPLDYTTHIKGRTRLDGIRTFLASRGIRIPEGSPDDPPGIETVCGVANRKNEQFAFLLEQRGVSAFDGVKHYLELARAAGLTCAVVSASAHTRQMLQRAGLSEFVDAILDADAIESGHLSDRIGADHFLAACRLLDVDPEHAAVFATDEWGVAAAHGAGFHFVVAIEPDEHPSHLRRLRDSGADVVVATLPDLLERSA